MVHLINFSLTCAVVHLINFSLTCAVVHLIYFSLTSAVVHLIYFSLTCAVVHLINFSLTCAVVDHQVISQYISYMACHMTSRRRRGVGAKMREHLQVFHFCNIIWSETC